MSRKLYYILNVLILLIGAVVIYLGITPDYGPNSQLVIGYTEVELICEINPVNERDLPGVGKYRRTFLSKGITLSGRIAITDNLFKNSDWTGHIYSNNNILFGTKSIDDKTMVPLNSILDEGIIDAILRLDCADWEKVID